MQVGFVGLGNVGAKLAGNLLRHGHTLRIRDLDREAAAGLLAAGAIWADSGRELAAASEVVITCLPSPLISAQVLEEADGVLEGLGQGAIWMEMSTTEAADVRRLGELVRARGASPLDVPVSGGCHRASTGNIAIFAGGERADFERRLSLAGGLARCARLGTSCQRLPQRQNYSQ